MTTKEVRSLVAALRSLANPEAFQREELALYRLVLAEIVKRGRPSALADLARAALLARVTTDGKRSEYSPLRESDGKRRKLKAVREEDRAT